jgi:hypothetical protein
MACGGGGDSNAGKESFGILIAISLFSLILILEGVPVIGVADVAAFRSSSTVCLFGTKPSEFGQI